MPVYGIRKKLSADASCDHGIRCGIYSLHLIVNNAVVYERTVLISHLIVPAFLKEDLFLIVNVGMEHRIQIDIGQIPEILVIAAGNGINGLVRIGHGI